MNLDNLAPVCLFTFKRLEETKKTILSLLQNDLSRYTDLIIYSDAGRNEIEQKQVQSVRDYLITVSGFKSIKLVYQNTNIGLAGSIIDGVQTTVDLYGRVIVLEDDLLTSSSFLTFMNQCLIEFENNESILSISGYSPKIKIPHNYTYDNAFNIRSSSWGWATWKNRWNKVDWNCSSYEKFKLDKQEQKRFNRGGSDLSSMLKRQMNGHINSWAIRFCYHQFQHGLFDVIPCLSLVNNIGFGEGASHCDIEYEQPYLDTRDIKTFNLTHTVQLNPLIYKYTRKPFTFKTRLLRLLKRYKLKLGIK